jgi:hypothetical protein
MHVLLVTVAVLVGFVWALVVFPSFRAVVAILAVLGTVGYFVLSNKAEQENKQQETPRTARVQDEAQQRVKFEDDQKAFCQAEQKRWAVVPPAQIEIRDPSLTEGRFPTLNDNYDFTASAKNKSKSRVTTLRINVTALDCPAQNARAADCDIVGHDDEKFDTDIPAGEVRQIIGKFTLRNVPRMRGVFSPRFAVYAGTRANRSVRRGRYPSCGMGLPVRSGASQPFRQRRVQGPSQPPDARNDLVARPPPADSVGPPLQLSPFQAR